MFEQLQVRALPTKQQRPAALHPHVRVAVSVHPMRAVCIPGNVIEKFIWC